MSNVYTEKYVYINLIFILSIVRDRHFMIHETEIDFIYLHVTVDIQPHAFGILDT